MRLYKRTHRSGNVSWWLDFTHEGQRWRVPTGKSNRRDADIEAAEIVQKIVAGEYGRADARPAPAPEIPLVSAALTMYVSDREERGRSVASYHALRHGALWDRALGHLRVNQITVADIDATMEKHRKRWKPATFNNRLNQLSGFLKWCSRSPRLWIADNAAAKIERLSIGQNARVKFLRPHEVAAIIEAAHPFAKAAIAFAAASGLRYSELCGLTKADFTKNPAVVTITDTKNGQPHSFPLEGRTLEIIEEQAKAAPFPASPLFPSPRGGHAHEWLRDRFQEAVKAAGLPYGRGRDQVSFHTLRHSFATAGLAAGLTERQLAELGNWRSLSMVRRYAKILDESARAGASAVSDAVLGAPRHANVTQNEALENGATGEKP